MNKVNNQNFQVFEEKNSKIRDNEIKFNNHNSDVTTPDENQSLCYDTKSYSPDIQSNIFYMKENSLSANIYTYKDLKRSVPQTDEETKIIDSNNKIISLNYLEGPKKFNIISENLLNTDNSEDLSNYPIEITQTHETKIEAGIASKSLIDHNNTSKIQNFNGSVNINLNTQTNDQELKTFDIAKSGSRLAFNSDPQYITPTNQFPNIIQEEIEKYEKEKFANKIKELENQFKEKSTCEMYEDDLIDLSDDLLIKKIKKEDVSFNISAEKFNEIFFELIDKWASAKNTVEKITLENELIKMNTKRKMRTRYEEMKKFYSFVSSIENRQDIPKENFCSWFKTVLAEYNMPYSCVRSNLNKKKNGKAASSYVQFGCKFGSTTNEVRNCCCKSKIVFKIFTNGAISYLPGRDDCSGTNIKHNHTMEINQIHKFFPITKKKEKSTAHKFPSKTEILFQRAAAKQVNNISTNISAQSTLNSENDLKNFVLNITPLYFEKQNNYFDNQNLEGNSLIISDTNKEDIMDQKDQCSNYKYQVRSLSTLQNSDQTIQNICANNKNCNIDYNFNNSNEINDMLIFNNSNNFN